MTIFRWILAFPVAVASWLFFPAFCSLFLPVNALQTNPLEFSYTLAVVCFLTPIASLGTLFLILPPGNRSGLVNGIIFFSIICVIGTLLVSFAFLIGGGPNPLGVIFFEFAGTFVGAALAYAYIPVKNYRYVEDRPLSKNDRHKIDILRWILAFPGAVACWIFVPTIFYDTVFLVVNSQEMHWIIFSVVSFLTPVISLGVLVLILPPGNRSGLVKSIVAFSIICAVTPILISFAALTGAGANAIKPQLSLLPLFLELAGTIVGALLAYAYVPLKSSDSVKE